MNFSLCQNKNCKDHRRPIIIVAQGINWHYDDGVSPAKARKELREFLASRSVSS